MLHCRFAQWHKKDVGSRTRNPIICICNDQHTQQALGFCPIPFSLAYGHSSRGEIFGVQLLRPEIYQEPGQLSGSGASMHLLGTVHVRGLRRMR